MFFILWALKSINLISFIMLENSFCYCVRFCVRPGTKPSTIPITKEKTVSAGIISGRESPTCK